MKLQLDLFSVIGKSFIFAYQALPVWGRWAVLPLILAFITAASVQVFEITRFPFWLAIISLPDLFFRGWLSAKLVRFFLLKEVGPVPQDPAQARNLASGVLVFVLINYFLIAVSANLMHLDMAALSAQQDPIAATFMLLGLVAGFWAVRYLWLFVPASVGYSMKRYLNHFKGWMGSIYTLMVIIACYLPIYFVLFFFVAVFEALGINFGEADGPAIFLLIGLGVVADLASSAVIAFAASAVLKHMAQLDLQQQKGNKV